MQVFSQVRFQWTRFQGSQPGDLFGSSELSVLEQPWPGGTTADLLARMEWNASAAGNAYVRRKGSSLHRLNPQLGDHRAGVAGGRRQPGLRSGHDGRRLPVRAPGRQGPFFQPSQVATTRRCPTRTGTSWACRWITPVLRDLQGDQMATEHKYKFFENGATPNMAIRFDPQVSMANVKAFIELFEEDHRGVANAFKTLYLGGGGDPVHGRLDLQGHGLRRDPGPGGIPAGERGRCPPVLGGVLRGHAGFDAERGQLRLRPAPVLRRHDGAPVGERLLVAAADHDGAEGREPLVRQPDPVHAGGREGPGHRPVAGGVHDRRADPGRLHPDSVVAAVRNNDWGLLKHSGLTSVQLVPPSSGQEPVPGFSPGTEPGPVPGSANGKEVARR
jgi:hypothetical protein